MRIPSKGRYAVTAMMDLAIHDQKGPRTIAEIADRQNISLSYLEQLFADLRKKQLIKGMRGPGGGYRLARSPETISVAEVLEAVDERLTQSARPDEVYVPSLLWSDLSKRLHLYLSGITLADCVKRGSELVDGIARNEEKEVIAL